MCILHAVNWMETMTLRSHFRVTPCHAVPFSQHEYIMQCQRQSVHCASVHHIVCHRQHLLKIIRHWKWKWTYTWKMITISVSLRILFTCQNTICLFFFFIFYFVPAFECIVRMSVYSKACGLYNNNEITTKNSTFFHLVYTATQTKQKSYMVCMRIIIINKKLIQFRNSFRIFRQFNACRCEIRFTIVC